MPSAFSARLARARARLRPARWTGRRTAAAGAALAVLVAAAGWAAWPGGPAYRTEERVVTVRSGPAGDESVALDTTLHLPAGASAGRPVPAVLLGHGFGGTKASVRTDAEDLAGLGYAVLTWTARGFGRSSGQVHLNSPEHEVRDAQRLLDWLAQRPEVRRDAAGDPRVGVVGGSYAGALALLLAARDHRVDAIVPMITWHDLARAFLPEATGGDPADGVFKKSWAGLFFGTGTTGPTGLGGLVGGDAADAGSDDAPAAGAGGDAPDGTGGEPAPGAAPPGAAPPGGEPGLGRGAVDPACGRFAADVCRAYLDIAASGRATPAGVALLRRASPAPVLSRIAAPTLLIQGEADTLFPLSEADANARGIAAAGTPVRIAWFTGGHDGGSGPDSDQNRIKFLTAQWLDHYVKGAGDPPPTSFTYSRIAGFSALDRGLTSTGYSVDRYPGLSGTRTRAVSLAGPPQRVANPPAGTPAPISSVPFAGALGSLLGGAVADLPGQHARFRSEPVATAYDIVGSPRVTIRAASLTGEAVLFVKLFDEAPDGTASLPGSQVAPVRLTGLPADIADAEPVTVTLPAIVHRVEAGNRLRLTVATADQAYATPTEPTVHTVALGDGRLDLPTVAGTPIPSPEVLWRWVLAGLLAALAVGLAAVLLTARRRHRRTDRTVTAEYADVPLVVRGLRKEYADGFVAVARVDFTVRRGQVVGLLGPNGAGKTTTLRVLMGLTRPTAGEVFVFGHRLAPGAPVLSRLGALVEGPGFLPHLTGLENLRAYWRATGRPEADAHLAEALEIAGLGDSVHRRTKTYSHGMKQRLAIAQAMLGLPELLVLDEPTDGLDPPQIAQMREVLRRYATGGRAVLVSSHLLAEVEQTCTHVVVVHKGAIVASGPVEEIVGDSPTVLLDVSDVAAATAVLGRLPGVRADAGPGRGAGPGAGAAGEGDQAANGAAGAGGAAPDGAAGDGGAGVGGAGGLVVDLGGTARSEVVAELVRAGVGVDRVVPRRRLEDAFLALVGDNSRGSGDR